MRSWTVLLLLCGLASAGCNRPRPAADPATACPSERALGELHDAAFHFQHGRATPGRAHLARARALIGPTHGARATELLGKLSEISTWLDRDADRAARETEGVRLALGDWPCLPPALHDRFHAALPPIAGDQAPAAAGAVQSIRRVELEAHLTDTNELGRAVRAVPVAGTGYRLDAIGPGSFLDRLGFQEGDVVKAVNEQPLATPELALHAWLMQRWASTFRVDLRRRGTDLRLEVRVLEQ